MALDSRLYPFKESRQSQNVLDLVVLASPELGAWRDFMTCMYRGRLLRIANSVTVEVYIADILLFLTG